MNSKKLYASLGLIALFILVLVIKDFFSEGLYQDETHYLPTAVRFSKEIIPSIALLKDYNELNTPLPFILGGWVIRIFGEDILNLRLLTYITSLVLLLLFVWTAPEKPSRLFLCLFGLLLFPSYYLCSIYYYTDIYAMLFVLAGLVAYLKKRHIYGAILMALAIACRQYMLAFPIAIIFFEIVHFDLRKPFLTSLFNRLRQDRTWLFYGIAVLSLVPWVILWKGLAPASVMEDQYYETDKLIRYNFGYVMYASAVLTSYYIVPETLLFGKWRFFIEYPKREPRRFILFVFITAVFVVLFPAQQAYNPYFTWPYLGYVDRLFETIGLTGIFKQIVFGVMMLVAFIRFFSFRLNLASYIVLFNLLILGKAQLSWDKYSLPMVMTLWYLALFDKEWTYSTQANTLTTGSDKSR